MHASLPEFASGWKAAHQRERPLLAHDARPTATRCLDHRKLSWLRSRSSLIRAFGCLIHAALDLFLRTCAASGQMPCCQTLTYGGRAHRMEDHRISRSSGNIIHNLIADQDATSVTSSTLPGIGVQWTSRTRRPTRTRNSLSQFGYSGHSLRDVSKSLRDVVERYASIGFLLSERV